jgi:hypothetical protein
VLGLEQAHRVLGWGPCRAGRAAPLARSFSWLAVRRPRPPSNSVILLLSSLPRAAHEGAPLREGWGRFN